MLRKCRIFLSRVVDGAFLRTERKLLGEQANHSTAKYQIKNLKSDNDKLKLSVSEISKRMIGVKVERMPFSGAPRFRLCVEIDERLMHSALHWGNDETMIDYLGQDIGHRAAAEIHRANIVRYQDDGVFNREPRRHYS